MSTTGAYDPLTRLVLAAGRGDRAALADFVRRSQPDVWRFHAHVVAAGAADDLTQETYRRALRLLRGFGPRSSAMTWLLSIARRAAAEHVRANSTRPHDDAVADSTHGLTREFAVRDAVGALSFERREAFVLTQMLGCTYAEAAIIVACPVASIRTRVADARADLIERVNGLDGRSPGSAVAGS